MKFFLDTANKKEIEKYKILIHGVTTNPTLAAREGDIVYEELIKWICQTVEGPVSAEVTALDAQGMVEEAKQFKEKLNVENLYIKVPCIEEGYKACQMLRKEGYDVNMTLCFNLQQAILAAQANATVVSPFVGRLEKANEGAGLRLVQRILDVYDIHQYKTGILAASIRSSEHVVQIAQMRGPVTGRGVDYITLPPKVMAELFPHPMTKAGLETFLADAKKYSGIGSLKEK